MTPAELLDGMAFLDLETGGLDHRRRPTLEVGLLSGDAQRGMSFLVDPGGLPVSASALATNGIPIEAARAAGLTAARAAARIEMWLAAEQRRLGPANAAGARRLQVVAHCAPFDLLFLDRLLERGGAPLPQELQAHRILDSRALLAGAAICGQVPWSAVGSLDRAAEYFGVAVPASSRHRAHGDAALLRAVVAHLVCADKRTLALLAHGERQTEAVAAVAAGELVPA